MFCLAGGTRVRPPAGKTSSTSTNQLRANVKRFDQMAVIEQPGCAEQLARFFSQVLPIRLPVQVTALRRGGAKLRDATVLEFGSVQHAIFVSNLPLEFDDHVRLQRAPQGPEADAVVVAVHYHEGQKAVAVRFTQGPCNWTRQP